MTYKDAISYLENHKKYGIRLGLKNIQEILKKFNEPHKNLKVIHITGSKGKTSVAYFINSILSKTGYKVGLFTSPYLINIRATIKINNIPISARKFAYYIKKIKKYNNNLTFFEILTTVSFLYFYDEKPDFVIYEVGLGGKKDATNVVYPIISIITNIEKEHINLLGNSFVKIVKEKIGIIKKNSIVISAVSQKNLIKLIKEKCDKENAKFIKIKENNENLHISLLGKHQQINATIAKTVASVLNIPYFAIEEGLKSTILPGRIEIISKKPLIILDGAHTISSILRLKETLETFKYNRLFVILSIKKDKDKKIIEILSKITYLFIVTQSTHNDSLSCELLKNELEKRTKKVKIIIRKTPKKAINYIKKEIATEDALCITGSLYLVADYIKFFSKTKLKKEEWNFY